MNKHTHRGTCQACGAKQAVNNDSQLVAKHGYKVAGFGFFNGICQGADHAPAEIEVFLTYRIIESCLEWAVNAERLADLYRTRALMVTSYDVHEWVRNAGKNGYGGYVVRTLPLIGCDDSKFEHEHDLAASTEESQANHARAHAKSLRDNVLTRLGKPLYKADHKAARQFNAGEVITLHGRQFKLISPRYGFSGSTVKYWKGEYADAPGKFFTPTIRTIRSQNQ